MIADQQRKQSLIFDHTLRMDVFLCKKEIGKLRHRIRPLANQSQNQSKEAANNSNSQKRRSAGDYYLRHRLVTAQGRSLGQADS